MTLRSTVGDIIEIAASAGATRDLESALLSRLQREVGFDVGFFLRRGVVGPGQHGLDARLVTRTAKRFDTYGAELAPVFARAQRDRGVAVDRDTLGGRFERTRLYREFIAPHRGHESAVVRLSLAGQCVAALTLGRCAGRSFAARDLNALAALVPALSLCELAVRNAGDACGLGLAPREAEVLAYLERGLTNREIARACGTSVHTVRNQLRRIFEKLGASTRTEAVAISLGRLQ